MSQHGLMRNKWGPSVGAVSDRIDGGSLTPLLPPSYPTPPSSPGPPSICRGGPPVTFSYKLPAIKQNDPGSPNHLGHSTHYNCSKDHVLAITYDHFFTLFPHPFFFIFTFHPLSYVCVYV